MKNTPTSVQKLDVIQTTCGKEIRASGERIVSRETRSEVKGYGLKIIRETKETIALSCSGKGADDEGH